METNSNPLHCTFTPSVAKLMGQHDICLIATSNQAGKIIILGFDSDDQLIQLPRDVRGAHCIETEGDRLIVSTSNSIQWFQNIKTLAGDYPAKPGVYDSMFIPHAELFIGEIRPISIQINDHALTLVSSQLNTVYSGDISAGIRPRWSPISFEPSNDSKLYLSGYISGEGRELVNADVIENSNSDKGWIPKDGVLLDMGTEDTIIENLSFPRCPRFYDGRLFLLESGKGELVEVNLKTKEKRVLAQLSGFGCGMAKWGDFLFIAMSATSILDFEDYVHPGCRSEKAKIEIIHLPTGLSYGSIDYHNELVELSDLTIIHGSNRPNLLTKDSDQLKKIVHTSDGYEWKF